MIRLPRAVVWVCVLVLAVAFVRAGISKLNGPSALRWAERFACWGYPAGAQSAVGVIEILGGLGVLIPTCRRAAGATLVAVMIGALYTHVVNAEFLRVLPPLILGGIALLVSSSHSRSVGS